ncbi:hypothetical protein X975_26161, partial [Stegodyphus mimosarum]
MLFHSETDSLYVDLFEQKFSFLFHIISSVPLTTFMLIVKLPQFMRGNILSY